MNTEIPSQSRPTPEQRWTTKRLLEWVSGALGDKGIDSPRLCAEMLLTHVLDCDRIGLYTQADRPATSEERDRLRDLVARALRHEPVQYLVGQAWFFGLALKSDRRALIPRPSTETIVETILQHARGRTPIGQPLRVADICTGSGCIAIALAKNLPESCVVATDLSDQALALARENATLRGVADRIEFREGSLLVPLLGGSEHFDYIASNPPYIPDHEWETVEPNVRNYEPTMALRGGADGLALVRPLIGSAPSLLAPGGLLLVEIAACTETEVLELAARQPMLRDTRVINDLEGLPRVLVGVRTDG